MALTVLSLVPLAACGYVLLPFEFDREVALEEGEVRGVVVRADRDGVPAPFASVVVEGGAIRRAGADGRFTVKGLAPGAFVIRAQDDVDGDGIAERSAVVSAVVRQGTTPSLVPGSGETVVSSVLLGPVRVDGTTQVAGRLLVDDGGARVTPDQAGLIGRVAVTREFDLPTSAEDVFDLVTLSSEAEGAADATGKFVLPSVGTGTFQVIAFLFEQGPNNTLGPLVGASVPQKLRGFAGETLDLFDTPFVVARAAALGERTVQLPLSPPPSAQVYGIFGPVGVELPPCAASPPPTFPAPFERARATPVVDATSDLVVTLPVGVFDVAVCTTDGQDGPRATAFQVVVPDGGDAAPPILLPTLALVDDDPCGDPSQPDCDGDGSWGLAPVATGNVALWQACVSQCQGAFGEAQGTRVCRVDDEVYDCDDDGDGQPDVTEHPNCYGLGRGTDLDGDGLCSGEDPFPRCAANTAAACDADELEPTPTIPDAYQGAVDDDPLFDAFFGDGGQKILGDPTTGTESARAVIVDESGHAFVASEVTPVESGEKTTRVRKLLLDGTAQFDFGSEGVAHIALEVEGTPMATTPVALVSDGESGAVYVLTQVDDPAGLKVSFVVTKLDASGLPVESFGALGTTIVNVGETIDAAFASTDAPVAAGLDESGVLWVVGTTSSSLIDHDLFACPIDGETGVVTTDLDPARNARRCATTSLSGTQKAFDAAIDLRRRATVVGTTADVEGITEARVWALDFGDNTLIAASDEPLPNALDGVAEAHAVHVSDDGLDVHVVGTIDGRLTLWRGGGDSTFAAVETIATIDTIPEAVARDGLGNVFAIGHRLVSGDQPYPYVHRFVVDGPSAALLDFSPEGTAERPLFETFGGAIHAAALDGDSLVLAGEARVVDVPHVSVWRLNPVDGPLDPGVVDAGPDPEPDPGDAGSTGTPEPESCEVHADCALCEGEWPAYPVCNKNTSQCECPSDPCLVQYGLAVLTPATVFTNPEDLAAHIPDDTACVRGEVVFDGFAGDGSDPRLASIQKIDGALVVRNTTTDIDLAFPALRSVDGLDVQDNWVAAELVGLRTLALGALVALTGTITVTDNGLLSTQAMVDVLDAASTHSDVWSRVTLTGNGCSDETSTECQEGHTDGSSTPETCAPHATAEAFVCQLQ